MSWKHAPVFPRTPLKVAQDAHRRAIRREWDVEIDVKMLRHLYSKMLLIRLFEEEVAIRAKGREGLAIHQYTGQEAVAVGVCSLLSKDDKVVSTHRPFGHFLAKGGDVKHLMAELYGRRTGVTKGVGGEMNLSDPSIGFLMSTMFVGANITISTGIALAQKLRKDDGITACFFGEGATTNGAFHEALIMASAFELPILYVCENNGYSTNTPSSEYLASPFVAQRASGYGLPTAVVDGSNVISVVQTASQAIHKVRSRGEPYFIEAIVGRIGPHKQELVDTRTAEEKRDALFRDPIARLKGLMTLEGFLTEHQDEELRAEIKKEVLRAVDFAKSSDKLTLEEVGSLIYAEGPDVSNKSIGRRR